ncbi:hypothetical protein X777_02646 [Ooceraea biroi]|uniref:Uncharacterized protein n=1 Tax=Ooceraea biroi TaxID=2015173 RepID=A0A026WN49_OOCBI|nr:hypothetical protein X777_02646 [Ooceraea biroi]
MYIFLHSSIFFYFFLFLYFYSYTSFYIFILFILILYIVSFLFLLYISNPLYHSSIFLVLNLNSYEPDLHEMQLLEQFERIAAQDIVKHNALFYITGYAAHRFRTRYSDLGVSTKDLPNPPNDWICMLSRVNCMYPSEKLQSVAQIMNTEFIKFHGHSLSTQDRIFDKVTDIVCLKNNNCIPREVISCLVCTRTYIRVRTLNRDIRVNNILKKKANKLHRLVSNKENVYTQIK